MKKSNLFRKRVSIVKLGQIWEIRTHFKNMTQLEDQKQMENQGPNSRDMIQLKNWDGLIISTHFWYFFIFCDFCNFPSLIIHKIYWFCKRGVYDAVTKSKSSMMGNFWLARILEKWTLLHTFWTKLKWVPVKISFIKKDFIENFFTEKEFKDVLIKIHPGFTDFKDTN